MRLSVIIPARNAAGDLPILLDALNPQLHPGDECLLVNDDSTDSTLDVAASYPIRVFSLKTRSGPAATRNLGASEAVGDVLVFLDSDVVPHADLLERMRRHFLANEILAAVIGSYDDQPASTAQVSLFRNLLHCYTHRTGNRRASTFWAGCGAIRRHVFEAAGGFDQRRYLEPSIEDIELGVRLRRSGAFILLDPELQVQHRKVWTLPVMLRTDVWNRAVPWSELILASRQAPADLNLKVSQRYSSAATVLVLLLLPFVVWAPRLASVAIFVLLASVISLNLPFYRFLARCGGTWFALRSIPLHLLHYLSGVFGFVIAAARKLRSCWNIDK